MRILHFGHDHECHFTAEWQTQPTPRLRFVERWNGNCVPGGGTYPRSCGDEPCRRDREDGVAMKLQDADTPDLWAGRDKRDLQIEEAPNFDRRDFLKVTPARPADLLGRTARLWARRFWAGPFGSTSGRKM